MTKKKTEKIYQFNVIYEPILEGGYQILVPAIPEIISFGRTLSEARKMAKEAIECALEGMQKEQILPPRDLKAKPFTEKILVSV